MSISASTSFQIEGCSYQNLTNNVNPPPGTNSAYSEM
jgi:hypothetical protein